VQQIVLFGAGKSATVLIDYLIREAALQQWQITVADASLELVLSKTKHHPNTRALALDINHETERQAVIREADLVISMMPPSLHILIAHDCIRFEKHLLTASYAGDDILTLADMVQEKKLLFLCEMGLDPGIDHMSAMQLIDQIKSVGGTVNVFRSHCGGLVAPESDNNPWHYKISWNPRNVVLAGKAGALYRENKETVEEAYTTLFGRDRRVTLHYPGLDELSYYPNRNSLPYLDVYDLNEAETFVRTTLRYPAFMQGWNNLVELNLTDETPQYETDGKSLCDFFKEHLDKQNFSAWLDHKLAQRFAHTRQLLDNLSKIMELEEASEKEGSPMPETMMLVDDHGELCDLSIDEVKSRAASAVSAQMEAANAIVQQLFFLGLDDKETLINKGFCSAADVLQFALETKLVLEPGDKDMIVMLHELEYTVMDKRYAVESQLVVMGDDNRHTAMAKTVGLPLGIAAKLILNGTIQLRGVHIPVSKEIYEPVLEELKKFGVAFRESNREL
jgi:saccharopine dehydrogenase-like NADP-dependent oxidoreductase